jgi:hypothetical protein
VIIMIAMTLFWAGLFVLGLVFLLKGFGVPVVLDGLTLGVVGLWAMVCAICGLTGR